MRTMRLRSYSQIANEVADKNAERAINIAGDIAATSSIELPIVEIAKGLRHVVDKFASDIALTTMMKLPQYCSV